MRCLFCGKELALLKRLTKGDDFCSEDHRRSYQNQFNELALSRLKHVQQVQQRHVARERAHEQMAEVGVMDGPDFSGPGFLLDIFDPFSPEDSKPQGLFAPEAAGTAPGLPERDFRGSPQQSAIPSAKTVRWDAGATPANHSAGPRRQTLEARDASRAAAVPPFRPTLFVREVFVPVAFREERRIEIEPRSPGQAKPWRARGPAFEQWLPEAAEFVRGDWTQPDGTPLNSEKPLGSEKWIAPSGQTSGEASNGVTANLASLEWAVSGSGEPPEPERVVKPVPVTLHGLGPAAAQPSTLALGASRSIEPRVPVGGALPLRPLMLVGTAVAGAAGAQGAQPAAKVSQPAAQPAAKAPQTAARANAQATPQPQARVRSEPAPVTQVKPEIRPETKPEAKLETRLETKPEAKAEPPKAAPEANPAPAAPPSKAPEPPRKVTNKVRRDVRVIPAAGRAAEDTAKHKSPENPVKPPAARPTAHAAPIEVDVRELHQVPPEKGFAALSQGVRIAIGIGAVAALILIWFLAFRGSPPKKVEMKVEVDPSVINGHENGYEVGTPVVNLGWIENWAPPETGKRISLFKGSQQLSDYRMEFKAAVQTKAIGWMFRGMNPRNYYVAKLEVLKPGSEPTVALVHYSVIDGKPEGRAETILPFKSRSGMTYNIRFEAVRSRFTAYVQDQKVDEWRDTRIGSGAVGMYSEPGEAAQVDGIVNLTALIPK